MTDSKNGLKGNKVGSWDEWAVWVVKTIEVQVQRIDRIEKLVTGIIISVAGGALTVVIYILVNHISK